MLTKRKRERTQINKIINERRETITYCRNTKSIYIYIYIREYCEQLYAPQMDNLEEMDKFLETQSQPKLIQEETDNLNKLISRSEIESIIKNKTK